MFNSLAFPYRPRQFQSINNGGGRTKCIIIEDSHRIYNGTFNKKSSLITARNPFRIDNVLIDYDMDSEDEWAEENGEDLEKKAGDEDEDEDMADEDQQSEGFIVSDGHLSVCEYDFSQDGEDEAKKLAEIKDRRERLKQQKQNQISGDKPYALTINDEGTWSLLREFTVLPLG